MSTQLPCQHSYPCMSPADLGTGAKEGKKNHPEDKGETETWTWTELLFSDAPWGLHSKCKAALKFVPAEKNKPTNKQTHIQQQQQNKSKTRWKKNPGALKLVSSCPQEKADSQRVRGVLLCMVTKQVCNKPRMGWVGKGWDEVGWGGIQKALCHS